MYLASIDEPLDPSSRLPLCQQRQTIRLENEQMVCVYNFRYLAGK